ncbi:MAG: hypothetical protein ACQEXJ_15435 [Myxococcota bacterium]
MTRAISVATALLVVCAAAGESAAQEVSPRWTFSGRGMLSNDIAEEGGGDVEPTWTLWNPSDTSVNVRVDNVFFEQYIGGFALGVRLTEPDSPLAPMYLYQVAGALAGEWWTVTAGRSRRPTIGVEFPTLRDEDLLEFRHPLTQFSVGGLEEDALFSDQAVLTLHRDFRWHAQLSLESLRDTTDSGDPAEAGPPRPNAMSVRLFYDELPDLGKVVRVKHVEVGLFGQDARSVPDNEQDIAWSLKGSASLNLNADPIHLLDLRAVAMHQHGIIQDGLGDVTATWRGRYVSGAAALRYLYAPDQLERLQVSLSGGYRWMNKAETSEWRVIPTVVWRLAVNSDLGFQYTWSHREAELASAVSAPEDEHLFQLAYVFHFDVRIHDSFSRPRSILNADYDYVPVY